MFLSTVAEAMTGIGHYGHTVTPLSGGDFFVLWRRYEAGTISLEGRRISATGGLGAAGVVSPLVDSSFDHPSVGPSPLGGLAVAWTDDRLPPVDESSQGIVGCLFDFTGPSGAPGACSDIAVLNTTRTSMQHTPRLAVSGDSQGLCFTDGSMEGGDEDPEQVRCRVLPAGWVVE